MISYLIILSIFPDLCLFWGSVQMHAGRHAADFSFIFIDAEDYATSEKWQKIFLSLLIIASLTSVSVAHRLVTD
jgi:hypothetical protein